MEMPLFHGVSYQKLSEIIGKHRFHFQKHEPGDIIVRAGDPCMLLSTVISGSVRVKIDSADSRVTVSQTLDAPEVIAPEYFFGRVTNYPATVTALDNCGIMQIEKRDYVDIINSDQVFLFNILNLLSMNAQRATDGVLALTSGNLQRRIAYWIVALTQNNGYDITMECRQRDLYSVFGVQRQSLISTLAEMKAEGLLDYTPQCIRVADRRDLVKLLDI